MRVPMPALACCHLVTVGLMGMGVGQHGAGDVAEAEGSRLSSTAERQPRSPHVAAVGPGLCKPRWPLAASPPASWDGNVSPTSENVVLGVITHATHQPHPTTHGTQDSLVPCPSRRLQLGTSQPRPWVPASPLLCSCGPVPSVTHIFSETSGGTRLWWSPGRCDGFSRAPVPAGDLWNKITAGSMHWGKAGQFAGHSTPVSSR